MNKPRIIDNPSKKQWESFLDKFIRGNLQQSFDYGEVAKASNPHTRVVRLLAMQAGHPIGLVQGRYNIRFGFGDRLEVGGVYGNGPLVADIEDKEQVLRELITDLEKYAIKNRVCEALVYRVSKDEVLESMGYTPFEVFNVYKVNLQKTGEELWKNIAHNKRRNIKKAQGQGVEVIQGTGYEGLVSFYEMHGISGKRAGFIPYPFSYFHSYLKIFGAKGKVKIFLAVFEGKQVAGVFVVIYGNTAYALGAGSHEESWHVRPNDMLHWKAMEWACSEGLSHYHMGYVSEPLPIENSCEWSLWRWKREWNGQIKKMFVYHRVYMPRFRRFVLAPYEKIYNTMRKISF